MSDRPINLLVLEHLRRAMESLGVPVYESQRPYDRMVDGDLGPGTPVPDERYLTVTCERADGEVQHFQAGIQFDANGRPTAYVIAPEPNRLTDAYGNRFFEVGDLVTRDGTDIHRVLSHNGSDGYAPDGFTVVCVKAPADGWCEVGDEEFNVCRRYGWIGAVQPEKPTPGRDADLPAVGSFHG